MATSVANVVSHFPEAENGFTTTLASTIASGATTVPLNSVAGYTNGQPAVFVVDPSDPTKKQTFTGIIDTSGIQVTSVVWTAGTNQTHAGGATVVDYATATHISMVSKGILVEHTQAGRHDMTSPKITTGINDANNNELVKFTATASAVNEITIANAATGNDPSIAATGGDTNIDLQLEAKGTGKVYNADPAAAVATVATAESTTSTSFTDLATSGPAVTVAVGPSGIAIVSLKMTQTTNTTGNQPCIGYTLSGANTLAASDAYSIGASGAASAANHRTSGVFMHTGLTPGSTTFTAKYKIATGSGGTNNMSDRFISVYCP